MSFSLYRALMPAYSMKSRLRREASPGRNGILTTPLEEKALPGFWGKAETSFPSFILFCRFYLLLRQSSPGCQPASIVARDDLTI
jgi:hypothetical protein